MKTIVKVLLGVSAFAAGFGSGLLYAKKVYAKVTAETIDAELQELRAHYNKKEQELNTDVEKIKEDRRHELLERYKVKAREEEDPGYPNTQEEIEEYNYDNDLYKGIEFVTEEDYEYDEDIANKVSCKMYNDGSVYSEDGNEIDTEKAFGNLLSGMGSEDCLRYIRNYEVNADYRVEYYDEEGPDGEESES